MGFLFITAQQTEKLIVPDSIQKAKFAETVEKIANMDLEKVLTNLVSESIWVGLKIVLALAIYMAGRWLIRRLIKLISTAFEKRKVDPSLQIFLHNLIKTISYIILILLIIQVMGINTTSIVALLASAGLAIGMALSGTLQNFAGGVMILLLKPYRIGDYISAQGQSGTVQEIMLFSTKITTADKQTIYIPNRLDRYRDHQQLFHLRNTSRGVGDRHLLRRRFRNGTGGYPGTAVQRRTGASGSGACGIYRCPGR